MKYKEDSKTALVKVLSDLIQSDGIVNQGEIDYIRFISHDLNIAASSFKKSESLSLSEAVGTLKSLGRQEKHGILKMIQQLSVSDDNIDVNESLLITALILSIGIPLAETQGIKASLVSIPNLAFDTRNSVLYVESDYDQAINKSIEEDYEAITKLLNSKERTFLYLPKVVLDINSKESTFRDMMQYIEPSLTEEQLNDIASRLDKMTSQWLSKEIFLNYLDIKGFTLGKPSFFFKIANKRPSHFQDFLILEICGDPLQTIKRFYKLNDNILALQPADLTEKERQRMERLVMPTSPTPKDELQYNGFHKIIIDTILKYNSSHALSRLFISDSGHIFLTDRNNIEIKMPALCRALYILFLRHEEGISLSDLSDYRNELLQIYKVTSTYGDENMLVQTVTNVVDFVGDTLNSNLSRIKKSVNALLGDEATYYLVQGERADRKRINLDRELVVFEDESAFEKAN